MVRRHRRRKSLTAFERERFAQEATEAHRRLNSYLTALTPLCDDYKAVLRLSNAIQDAIRDITGDEPEWCKVQRGYYPGC